MCTHSAHFRLSSAQFLSQIYESFPSQNVVVGYILKSIFFTNEVEMDFVFVVFVSWEVTHNTAVQLAKMESLEILQNKTEFGGRRSALLFGMSISK